ncbi:hypothetical protein MCUN1_001751 [Malassezia cuniculi]|uniref:Pinin/SDK/MemA protein domain-containing protein n=1 Tax=Malassezia cuniculi TaxID=948313 RepID=A0AAF0JB32_9BASI|nr:hypothetical protein MCUN1_001751 [Malassezia cuniculi]
MEPAPSENNATDQPAMERAPANEVESGTPVDNQSSSEHAPSRAPATRAKRAHDDDAAADERPRRRPLFAAEDRERGRRMLGLLNATLGSAQRQRAAPQRPAAERPIATAAKQPLADSSLAAERRAHDEERAAVRSDLSKIRRLAERIVELETAHRAARSHARRLSSFLVTRTAESARPARTDMATQVATSPAYTSGVPLVRTRDTRSYDVYYLPRTLLPEQEDMLDEQEERTDAALDKADDDWERELSKLQTELADAKRRLEKHHIAW